MGVVVIPNQTIAFYDEEFNIMNKRCTQDNARFCQLVRTDQIQQFQVQITPETGDDLVVNGDFIDTLDPWASSGFVWQQNFATSSTIGATLGQTLSLEANAFYKISYRIQAFNGIGVSDYVAQIDFALGSAILRGGDFFVNFASNPVDQWLEFSFYAQTIDTVNQDIVLKILSGTIPTLIQFDDIEVIKLTTPIVTLTDSNDVVIQTVPRAYVFKDRITYQIEWNSVADEGEYKICISNDDDLDFNFLGCELGLFAAPDSPLAVTETEGDCLVWWG